MGIIFNYIREEAGNKTKHQQIIDGIMQAISDKKLKQGDTLPSVNMFLKRLSFARMTVVKALEDLKAQGIIESEQRVGYFVKDGNINKRLKVMLFLKEFNVYHEIAYNEIIKRLKTQKVTVDLYFHHCNSQVFGSILKENLGLYGLYVVTPFDHPQVQKSLSKIPSYKLLQVMRSPQLEGTSYISQDFYDEVINALKSIKNLFLKYKKVTLSFPDDKRHPKLILQAFSDFCKSSGIEFSNVSSVNKELVKESHAFFVIADNDLIQLVKYGEEKGLELGKNLGILSYNDTPMKEIIKNGITVISTDFKEFGLLISEFILTRKPIQKQVQTKIILRKSL